MNKRPLRLICNSFPMPVNDTRSLLDTTNALKDTVEVLSGKGNRKSTARKSVGRVSRTYVQAEPPEGAEDGDFWVSMSGVSTTFNVRAQGRWYFVAPLAS